MHECKVNLVAVFQGLRQLLSNKGDLDNHELAGTVFLRIDATLQIVAAQSEALNKINAALE